MVNQNKVYYFVAIWKDATKKELRARLAALKNKANTPNGKAEIKAIKTLLL